MKQKKLLKKAIKRGFRFRAMDKSGQVFLYRKKPCVNKELGMWESCEVCIFVESFDSGKGWKKSLRKIA